MEQPIITCCAHFAGHFTESIVERLIERRENARPQAEEEPTDYILADSESGSFSDYDSEDCLFEEYSSPWPVGDRFAWKQARPSV